MERRSAIFSVVCLLCALPVARAQDLRISIPAWIETEKAIAPKFEATLNGTPASVSAQLGPSSDQVILIVLDVTGDPSYVDPARQALVAEISKLPHNTWVALLRAQAAFPLTALRRDSLQASEGSPSYSKSAPTKDAEIHFVPWAFPLLTSPLRSPPGGFSGGPPDE